VSATTRSGAATDLCFAPAAELALKIRQRQISPVEVTEAFLERIEARNPALNAYVSTLPEAARADARRSEAAVMAGAQLGPLHGVPVAIKDGHAMAGTRTTSGSRAFEHFVARADETPVARVRAAGAIVLGKTNLPEFGHKGVTDNALFGPTQTPFAPGYNAGGSSGGSAASFTVLASAP
jgi:amidase/aspartyl-tRNA(Asn)/glutamyl-tRNA(Gln) amidotransferase subunit A